MDSTNSQEDPNGETSRRKVESSKAAPSVYCLWDIPVIPRKGESKGNRCLATGSPASHKTVSRQTGEKPIYRNPVAGPEMEKQGQFDVAS